MRIGDHVTWMCVPRGGYGYSMPIDVEVVGLSGKHALVRAKKRSGEEVRRRVALSSLREKPVRRKGLSCRYCDCPLEGVLELGSGVYDRLCHARDGDACERVGSHE